MPARRSITTAALVLAVALASPAAAAAQGSGPGELWRAYPLDPATGSAAPQSPAPAQPRQTAPAPSGDDDGPPIAAVAAGLVAVAGLVALAAAVRARRERRARTVVPAAAAPRPERATPAPPAEPVPAPLRRLPGPDRGLVALARLSAEYLDLVASGSRRPVVEIAERHGWDIERTRRALGRARAQGLLVGAGRGRAGGALSPEAERLLAQAALPTPEPAPERGALVVGGNGRVGAG